MATTLASLSRASSVSCRVARPARRSALVVRATSSPEEPSTPAPAPTTPVATPLPVAEPILAPQSSSLSFGEAMAFSGPAPEIINGRLSMLAVISALGAEFASNESVWEQFQSVKPEVFALTAAVAVGSLIPLLKGANQSEAFGPFTPKAEMLNGRAAMIGLAALILIELVKGAALF